MRRGRSHLGTTDREPSPARSSHERKRVLLRISSPPCSRTRCEPRTARGPFIFGRSNRFVAVLTCARTNPGISMCDRPGTRPSDFGWNRAAAQIRKNHDREIVSALSFILEPQGVSNVHLPVFIINNQSPDSGVGKWQVWSPTTTTAGLFSPLRGLSQMIKAEAGRAAWDSSRVRSCAV